MLLILFKMNQSPLNDITLNVKINKMPFSIANVN